MVRNRKRLSHMGLALFLLAGCHDLWRGNLSDNPDNCIQVPGACTELEFCNPHTEVCESRLDLTAVSPARGPSSGGLPLTITGRSFIPGTRVSFGMPAVAADALVLDSDTQLRATLPPLPGACGPVPITAERPDGFSVTRRDLFSYFVGAVTFAAAKPLALASPSNESVHLLTADFNRDGKADLVATAYNAGGIDVLLGDGAGGFTPQPRIPTGGNPYFLAVADVDGNGAPDIAVANNSGSTVSVLLGAGDGTFQAPMNLSITGPESAHFIDVDSNGTRDLAVLSNSGKLRIWLGDGAGGFVFKSEVGVDAGAALGAAADVNGDGRDDLIVTSAAASGAYLSVFLNKGDTTFQQVGSNAIGSAAASCASADFNGDGKPDLVAAEYASGMVSVFLGNGDGTFAARRSVATGVGSRVVAVGDLNCDGRVDVAVGHLGSPLTIVLLGKGDGSFEPNPISVPAVNATSALAVTIADVNGDQRPDLLLATDGSSPSVQAVLSTAL